MPEGGASGLREYFDIENAMKRWRNDRKNIKTRENKSQPKTSRHRTGEPTPPPGNDVLHNSLQHEEDPSKDVAKPTRRQFIRYLTGLSLAGIIAATISINETTEGLTGEAAAQALKTSTSDQLKNLTQPETLSKESLDNMFKQLHDISPEYGDLWMNGGVGKDINTGFRNYFYKNISLEPIQQIIDTAKKSGSSPEVVLSMMGFWSHHKIKDQWKMFVEALSNLGQSTLGGGIEAIDAGLIEVARQLSRPYGHNTETGQTDVPNSTPLRNIVYSALDSTPDNKLKFAVGRGITAVPNVAYLDRNMSEFINGIELMRQKDPNYLDHFPEEFVKIYNKVLRMKNQVMNTREKNNNHETIWDATYIQYLNQMNVYLLKNRNNIPLEMDLTASQLCYIDTEVTRQLDILSVNTSNIKPEYWTILKTYASISGLDCYTGTKIDHFNPRIDNYYDPPSQIEHTLSIMFPNGITPNITTIDQFKSFINDLSGEGHPIPEAREYCLSLADSLPNTQ